jgi:acetyl-CoA synthetase
MTILEYRTYEEAKKGFHWDQVWGLFDGNKEKFNIAHECIDRHVGKGTAIRLKYEDGHTEQYTFEEVSTLSSQFANFLESLGVGKGDRVAIMLDPCLEFYVSLFGTLKRGAVVVPCFQLFGPEALEYRIKDSQAKFLITTQDKTNMIKDYLLPNVFAIGPGFRKRIEREKSTYQPNTAPMEVAVFQYTSGTTKQFPDAVKHYHRSVVTLMPGEVFARGLRPGDRQFCPSPPAWGHGLWHGTFAPLALGVPVGAYSGKFNIERFFEALEEFEIETINAMPTVFRMMKDAGISDRYNLKVKKCVYTGEPMDMDTFNYIKEKFGVPPYSGYGSAEAGSLIYHFAGFKGWEVKPGSLGKPLPGIEVALIDEKGQEVPAGQIGEVALKRRGQWFRVKDLAVVDEDGYFWHKGRADDVIISSGWTISPVEVEDMLLRHPSVKEAAVVGVPDKQGGQIVKAFIVSDAKPSPGLIKELQDFVKNNLSKHEYPKAIEFLPSLPKTEGGKVKRKELKDRG